MNPLRQFDQSFGLEFTSEQTQKMFVNNVENAIFEAIERDKYPGINYWLFMPDLCLKMGLNKEEYQYKESLNFKALKSITNSDFIQTLRMLVALYAVMLEKKKEAAEKLNAGITSIIEQLPAFLPVKWYNGNFYRDELPEVSGALMVENFLWLSAFPAARTNLEIALKNYSAGSTKDVVSHVYIALENVIQKITGCSDALHNPSLHTALNAHFNLPKYFGASVHKFINYTNDMDRHGKNDQRHEVDPDELEGFLFMALVILRMLLKKQNGLMSAVLTEEILLKYMHTSAVVRRIELAVMEAYPKFERSLDSGRFHPAADPYIKDLNELGYYTLRDVENALLKHERKIIVLQQEEFEGHGENMLIVAGQAVHWLMDGFYQKKLS